MLSCRNPTHRFTFRLFLFLGLLLFCPRPHSALAAQSLGLKQLIDQAIINHPSIGAAKAELGAARAEERAARAQYFPTPSVQVMQDKGDSTTILALQQPLWAGGRLDAGLGVAQARTTAGEVAIDDAGYNLALRLTAAWAGWLQARGRGEALADGVALLQGYEQSVRRRIEGGASAQVDRELVAARLAQTHGDLAASRSAERSALARLSQMVGRPLRSADLAVVDPAAAEQEAPLPPLDILIDRALAHSAALKRLTAEIDTARHEAARRRAVLWPTLSLRAQHRRDDLTGTDLIANDSRLMLALEYLPGAGLSAGANIEAAEASLLARREQLETARRELIEMVSTDYEELQASHDRLRETRRTIKASAEVLASYDRLFVAGRRGWLDVINAARELIQARVALVELEAIQLAARARLSLRTGEQP